MLYRACLLRIPDWQYSFDSRWLRRMGQDLLRPGRRTKLAEREQSYLVVIDNSGSAQTSSIRNPGYGSDEYFYISSSGVRTKLKLQGVEDAPNDMVHDFTFQSAPREVTLFFVGPRAAVKTTPRPELAH